MFNKITCKLNWECDKEIDCKDCDLLHRENLDEIEVRELDLADIERAVDDMQDSGNRTRFESGAVRDVHEGKGDCLSIPPNAILRLSSHYEKGAKKYERFNFMKGIPCTSFIDSAERHLLKYKAGWDDEDHLAAMAFNILGAMEMEAIKPEMQDIPNRQGKKSFKYGV